MIGLYDAVAARIRANCAAVLQVAVGMKPQEVVEMMALGPDVSALVHPMSDQASRIREAGMKVSQQELWRFGVTAALVFPGGFAQFEPARDQIKGTLRGWAPEGASMPIEYAGSRMLEYSAKADGGRWLHLFEFLVTVQETYEHQS